MARPENIVFHEVDYSLAPGRCLAFLEREGLVDIVRRSHPALDFDALEVSRQPLVSTRPVPAKTRFRLGDPPPDRAPLPAWPYTE